MTKILKYFSVDILDVHHGTLWECIMGSIIVYLVNLKYSFSLPEPLR